MGSEGSTLKDRVAAEMKDALRAGDKITLQAAPTKDGSDGGYALGVIAADGTRF